MDIRRSVPGKVGIEHVKKFNHNMEGAMTKDRQVGIWKGDELKQMLADTPPVQRDNIEATYVGPKCPHCETRTQYHNGAETCPVHGKVLIDE